MQYFTLSLVTLTSLCGLVSASPRENIGASNNLQIRDKDVLNCCPVNGQGWSPQSPDTVKKVEQLLQNDVQHFKTVAGKCYTAAQVDNVAAVLCNDAYDSTVRPQLVADYVQYILNHCKPDVNGKICGQLFNTGHWNVILDKYTDLPSPDVAY